VGFRCACAAAHEISQEILLHSPSLPTTTTSPFTTSNTAAQYQSHVPRTGIPFNAAHQNFLSRSQLSESRAAFAPAKLIILATAFTGITHHHASFARSHLYTGLFSYNSAYLYLPTDPLYTASFPSLARPVICDISPRYPFHFTVLPTATA
jgi:hypothetical protein